MFKHTLWGLGGVRNGFRLRIYGFTDLPPSLPLFPGTPWTRTPESSYRRPGEAETPRPTRQEVELEAAKPANEEALLRSMSERRRSFPERSRRVDQY